MKFDVSDDDVILDRSMIALILSNSYNELLLPLYVVRCAYPTLPHNDLQTKLHWDSFKLNKMIDHLNSLSCKALEEDIYYNELSYYD